MKKVLLLLVLTITVNFSQAMPESGYIIKDPPKPLRDFNWLLVVGGLNMMQGDYVKSVEIFIYVNKYIIAEIENYKVVYPLGDFQLVYRFRDCYSLGDCSDSYCDMVKNNQDPLYPFPFPYLTKSALFLITEAPKKPYMLEEYAPYNNVFPRKKFKIIKGIKPKKARIEMSSSTSLKTSP